MRLTWNEHTRGLTRPILAAALALLCFSQARAQEGDLTPPKVEVKATFGASGFGDEISYPHVVAGGAVRFYVTRRFSVEPEFLYMRQSANDQDYVFTPGVAYDLTDPTNRAVPYIAGGVGAFHHRGRFTSSTAWTGNVGAGVKIFLNDRLFIAPDARLGVVGSSEMMARGTVSIGYVLSGRRR
jgi:hypothetical protein